jgi:hypothetical protein
MAFGWSCITSSLASTRSTTPFPSVLTAMRRSRARGLVAGISRRTNFTCLKDEWLGLGRTRPEVLIQAALRMPTETGPLEALLAELEYDLVVVGGALDQGFPQLGAEFDRAIGVNALAPRDGELRSRLLETYKLVNDTNRLIEKLTHLTAQEQRGASMYRSTDKVLRENRERLRAELPPAIAALGSALGRPNVEAL